MFGFINSRGDRLKEPPVQHIEDKPLIQRKSTTNLLLAICQVKTQDVYCNKAYKMHQYCGRMRGGIWMDMVIYGMILVYVYFVSIRISLLQLQQALLFPIRVYPLVLTLSILGSNWPLCVTMWHQLRMASNVDFILLTKPRSTGSKSHT